MVFFLFNVQTSIVGHWEWCWTNSYDNTIKYGVLFLFLQFWKKFIIFNEYNVLFSKFLYYFVLHEAFWGFVFRDTIALQSVWNISPSFRGGYRKKQNQKLVKYLKQRMLHLSATICIRIKFGAFCEFFWTPFFFCSLPWRSLRSCSGPPAHPLFSCLGRVRKNVAILGILQSRWRFPIRRNISNWER